MATEIKMEGAAFIDRYVNPPSFSPPSPPLPYLFCNAKVFQIVKKSYILKSTRVKIYLFLDLLI